MVRVLRLATIAAGLWLAATSTLAAAVAFVTDLHGEARIAGGAKLTFLAELEPDARLALGKGARVTVIYVASGTEFTLSGPGEFVVASAEVKALNGSAPQRRTAVARPDPMVVSRLAETATASIRMRSASAPKPASKRPALLYPRATRIATLQPTLSWSAEMPAGGFSVVLATADGKPIWHGKAQGSSVKSGAKLAPGTRYSWSLLSGDTVLGEASFETLSTEAIRRADASRAAAKTFSDRILHAFVLQDVGAEQDARQVWAQLASERPDLPELAVLAR